MNPIVGIGELLWDVFPDGRKVAGGAPFNFAFHCNQLGHEAVIVSRVGDDDLGRELREEVKRLGMSDEFIQTDRDHPTGTVQVAVDASGQPTYTITEDVAWDYINLESRLSVLAEFAAALCFGSLAQRSKCSASTVNELLKWLPTRTLRVYDMNVRETAWHPDVPRASVNEARWIKVNEEEFAVFFGSDGADFPQEEFHRRLGTWGKIVIVTRGECGYELFAPFPYGYGQHHIEPGVPARVVDTVGAGDAFTAAMVCLHLEGRPLRECARFANHYAARVCEHRGATPRINRAEVELAAFGEKQA